LGSERAGAGCRPISMVIADVYVPTVRAGR
jgi:hypothetical protein